MSKVFKKLSVFGCLILVLSLMTGCFSTHYTTRIVSDGSGSLEFVFEINVTQMEAMMSGFGGEGSSSTGSSSAQFLENAEETKGTLPEGWELEVNVLNRNGDEIVQQKMSLPFRNLEEMYVLLSGATVHSEGGFDVQDMGTSEGMFKDLDMKVETRDNFTYFTISGKYPTVEAETSTDGMSMDFSALEELFDVKMLISMPGTIETSRGGTATVLNGTSTFVLDLNASEFSVTSKFAYGSRNMKQPDLSKENIERLTLEYFAELHALNPSGN